MRMAMWILALAGVLAFAGGQAFAQAGPPALAGQGGQKAAAGNPSEMPVPGAIGGSQMGLNKQSNAGSASTQVSGTQRGVKENAQAHVALRPVNNKGGEQWRYRFYNDQWWYWLPEGHWVFWRDGKWVECNPNIYAAPATEGTYSPGYDYGSYSSDGYYGSNPGYYSNWWGRGFYGSPYGG